MTTSGISWAKLASAEATTKPQPTANYASKAAAQPPSAPVESTESMPSKSSSQVIKYSRDQLISLFKPDSQVPADFDTSLPIYEPNSLVPVMETAMTDIEKLVWDSGVVHSEVAVRKPHHFSARGRGEYHHRGGRGGRGRGGSHQNTHNNQPDANGWVTASTKRNSIGNVRPPGTYQRPQQNANGETEHAPSEDLWDIPSGAGTGTGQGTFANGAFVSTDAASAAEVMALSPSEWKHKEQGVISMDSLSNSFAILGNDGSSSATWTRPLVDESKLESQRHQNNIANQAHHQKQQHVQEHPVWYYKDPQGQTQGPFNGAEMQQWFEAGYFPDQLLVKLSTDRGFTELLSYVEARMSGRVDFTAFPKPEIRSNSYLASIRGGNTTISEWDAAPAVAVADPSLHKTLWNSAPVQTSATVSSVVEETISVGHRETKPAAAPVDVWKSASQKQQQQVPQQPAPVVEKQAPVKVAAEPSPKTAASAAPWKQVDSTNSRKSIAEIQQEEVKGKSSEAVPEITVWVRQQLAPLAGKVDSESLVEVLSTLDDPYTITEIIHDAIGTHFKTVDPQKLAGDIIKRLHAQGKLAGNLVIPPPPTHSAMFNSRGTGSTKARSSNEDFGFTPVVSKKKKKKNVEDPRVPGSSVGVGGKIVVGAVAK